MKNQPKGKIFLLYFITIFLLSGCAGASAYSVATTGNIGFNPLGIIVGLVLMYYTWEEAKKQNRNRWIWITLTFLFGLIPAVILILYLKEVPPKNNLPDGHL